MNNERVTLAQELHDGIAQDLVVLGFSIDQAISDCNDPDLIAVVQTAVDDANKAVSKAESIR